MDELMKVAHRGGVPDAVLKEAGEIGKAKGWQAFLYEVLKGDMRLIDLQRRLETEPGFVRDLAEDAIPTA